jgi:hypothetical protein
LLHGDLRDSREWPPILIKGCSVANYKDLRMILNRKILPDADTTRSIYLATKPFAGRRRSDSCGPYHSSAWNPLITDYRTICVD